MTFRHTSDQDTILPYERIKQIVHEQQFLIAETNTRKIAKGTTITMKMKDYEPAASSEHVVFYAEMIVSKSESIDVCIKFERVPNHGVTETFKNFTQKHYSAVLFNYSKAQALLNDFSPSSSLKQKIQVNDVYCCETKKEYESKQRNSKITFWVEREIKDFKMFWDLAKPQYIDQMLTSNVSVLKEFQIHVFNKSGWEYTIIDLQGGKIKDGEEELYILGDIEFSFCGLYAFTGPMMRDRFAELHDLKTVNLRDLSQRLDEFNHRLDGIDVRLDGIEHMVGRTNELISQTLATLMERVIRIEERLDENPRMS